MKKIFFVVVMILCGFFMVGCESTPTGEVENFTITFNANGGSNVASITSEKNSNIQKPSDPTKEGFIFDGWYLESSLTTQVQWPHTLNSNVTLYAKWINVNEVTTYNIKWEVNGVIVQEDLHVIEGVMPTYRGGTPTKTATAQYSYTFTGWSPQVVSASANQTYVAQFSETIRQYTVSFNSSSGTNVSPVTLNYGSTLQEPAQPTREGHKFMGWFLDSGLTQSIQWPLTVTQNQTLYAKWNESVPYVQYLTTLLSGYSQSPLSYIPESMLPGNTYITSQQAGIDYTSFVNTSSIPYGGHGEQWNMVVSNLKESQNFFSILTIVDTLSAASIAAFNNYIDSNPADTAQYTFLQGIYSITIKFEDSVIFYVIEYTANLPLFGTQTIQIALSQNIVSGEKVGRIQIGQANALRYVVTNNSYQFAIRYGGIRRAYFEISKDASNNVEGRIFEYLGIDGSFSLGSAAEFYISNDYVSVVGNKSSSMMGWSGTITELYSKQSGKLLGYEVRETLSSITYNTLWFNLGDTSGISSIRFLVAPLENSNPHLVYINGLDTVFVTRSVGGISLKALSRRYDIELRKQYFYYQQGEEIVKAELLIPMIFVQQEQLSNLVADVNNRNSGLTFSLNVSSTIQNKIMQDYSTLIDPFISRKDDYTVQTILDFIGSAYIQGN